MTCVAVEGGRKNVAAAERELMLALSAIEVTEGLARAEAVAHVASALARLQGVRCDLDELANEPSKADDEADAEQASPVPPKRTVPPEQDVLDFLRDAREHLHSALETIGTTHDNTEAIADIGRALGRLEGVEREAEALGARVES